jgi:hypothetical protein
MLVVKGEMVICIEAKFGSGNPVTYDGEVKNGEKPTSRAGLLARYLGRSTKAQARIRPDFMTPTLHSQLFRNVVFASEMAEKDWQVVNLVSKAKQGKKDNPRYSFADPTKDVQSYLHADFRECFTCQTWEALYNSVIRDAPDLAVLAAYMRGKIAHYRRAFELA